MFKGIFLHVPTLVWLPFHGSRSSIAWRAVCCGCHSVFILCVSWKQLLIVYVMFECWSFFGSDFEVMNGHSSERKKVNNKWESENCSDCGKESNCVMRWNCEVFCAAYVIIKKHSSMESFKSWTGKLEWSTFLEMTNFCIIKWTRFRALLFDLTKFNSHFKLCFQNPHLRYKKLVP